MNIKKFFIVISALAGLWLAGCSDEMQLPINPADPGSLNKVTIIYHTGNDWPVELLDPGTIRLEGDMRITQHVKVKCRLETTNPLITGDMVVDYCSRINIYTGEGHVNGLAAVTPDDISVGGIWECSFQGRTIKTGQAEWSTLIDIVGHGKGGEIQAMQVFYSDNMISWDSPTTFWYGTGSGYMKSNGN